MTAGRPRAGLALLITLPCLILGLAAGAGAKDTATASATTTFGFTGGEQIFEVPDGVTSLEVTTVGGKGGNGGDNAPGVGGFGAAASARLAVTPGQILFIEVGGNGINPSSGFDRAFNGGGSGSDGLYTGAGGGGASDIRTISRAGAGNTLGSRLIIAGGGGGGGAGFISSPGGDGGWAGQLASGNGSSGGDGDTGSFPGGGGTQTGGGISLVAFGSEGQGGDGGPTNEGEGGGGGGGGKFGGGGAQSDDDGASGGGAGSTSFAPTAANTSFKTDFTGVPLVRLTYEAGGKNASGLKFGKVKLNKRKGTATLRVTVPGSGNLTVGGKGVVKKRPGVLARWLARKVNAAGTYKLKVKAKGRKKRKLFSTGKVKVKAVISFKPTSGDKVSDSKRIKLKKN